MRFVFATIAVLMLSGAGVSAQEYCNGSEGTGTSGNTVTGTRCPIGQPGWAMPSIGAAPSDGATTGRDSGKAPAQKKRGNPDDRRRSHE